MKNKLSLEMISALKSVVSDIQREDEEVYYKHLALCKKSELFWNGIQHIFWDDSAHDWRLPSQVDVDLIDEALYNRVINIYKAHGESVIAALSIEVPKALFFPEDADNVDDVTTARAIRNIAELIQQHNKADLIFIHALYILFNQGFVGGYNYPDQNKKYGTVPIEHYKDIEVETNQNICPMCGESISEPSDETGNVICPSCENTVIPEQQSLTETNQVLDKIELRPKIRRKLEVFGPLNIKVPFYAKNQDSCGYLMLSTESDEYAVKDVYPDINIRGSVDTTQYQRWSRMAMNYKDFDPISLVTIRKVWLRPSQYNRCVDDIRDQLKKDYPEGCCIVMADEEFADLVDEELDDHWTLSISPLSLHIHARPIGESLLPVQEMSNDLLNLELQTIEQGIPETFADSEVLDFEKYSTTENRPGMIYPVKGRSGISIESSFHTLRTATLSQEAKEFKAGLEQAAQFVTGSFPSIYGGPASSGSKTLGEYAMSRNQALQRLSTVWKMMSYWWSDFIGAASISYIDDMLEDEKLVKYEMNSFFNVWIRKAELTGKVGNIVPEHSDKFPISWSQKRDTLVELLGYQIPEVSSVVFSPDNAEMITQTFGFSGIIIPGENDRIRQRQEINELIVSQPQDNGQGMMIPSIMIDPDVDDDAVHIQTMRSFLVSPIGYELKTINQAGYENCRAHLKMHEMNLQMKTMQQSANTVPGQNPDTNAPKVVE